MHSITTQFSLVFLTTGECTKTPSDSLVSLPADTVSTVTSAEEALAVDAPDCLLVDATGDVQTAIDSVTTVRAESSVPIIAFAGTCDSSAISRLFQAGVDDIIQSTPSETAPEVLHRRIETALDAESKDSFQTLLQYRTIIESAADAIYQLDAEGNFVAANDATAELLRTTREVLLESNAGDFLDDEDVARAEDALGEQLRNAEQEFHTLDLTFQSSDGVDIPCGVRFSALQVDGEFVGSVGVIRSEREKRAREQRLQERDELLRLLSENLKAVVLVAEPSGVLDFVSNAFEEILGHQPTHLFDGDEQFFERIHPEDRTQIRETRRQKRSEPDTFDETYRLLQEDGTVKWVREQWFGVYENDALTRIVGITQDITETKEREQELERQRKFAQQTQDVAAIAGWELMFTDNSVRWTDEVYSLLNLPQSFEPTFDNILERYHPDDKPRLRRGYELARNGSPIEDLEVRIKTGDGEMRWFQLSGELIFDAGKPVGIRGVFKDIHDRKQREQQLQDERDLIERILETSPVGIVVYDAAGRIVRANEQASTLLDIEHEALLRGGTYPEEITLYSPEGDVLDDSDVPFERIKQTGEPVDDVEVAVEQPSGNDIVLNVDGIPLFDDGELSRVILAFDDITDRVEREQQLKEQRNELTQLDRLNHIIRGVDKALLDSTSRDEIEAAVCDNLSLSGRYKCVVAFRTTTEDGLTVGESGPHAESFAEQIIPIEGASTKTCPAHRAIDTGEREVVQNIQLPEQPLLPDFQSLAADMGIGSMVAIPVGFETRQYGVITVHAEAVNAFGDRELEVLGELGEMVGHAIAAVESREREETLTALYEATQDLLAAESRWAVSRVVVTTAADVLSPAGIGIFLFDDEENVLRPAAATDALHEFYDDLTAFGPGKPNSVVWQTYVDGETTMLGDVQEMEQLAYPDTDARQTLVVPLGDHGVFVVTDTDHGPFDEEIQRLIGLLAATTEAAFDRVEGQADIEKQDEELAQRRERIDRFEDMFALIGDIDQHLRRGGTRAEIERSVCERFTATDQYLFAWVGRTEPKQNELEPQAWAGVNDGYLDTARFDTTSQEPAARTARTGEPTVIKNVTDHLRKADWAHEALDRGYQSMIAVPLVYGEATYGVLTVYADEPNAFDDIVEPVVTTLGETIAYSINNTETRQGILADSVVEVELEIEGASTFLNAVAEVADEPVSYREITPESDGRSQVLFAVSGAVVDAILDLQSQFLAVESLTHIENDSEHLFRATIAEPTVADILLECGAIPKRVTAQADSSQVCVHLPRERDVREFLNRLRERYPRTTLQSQRTVESRQTQQSFHETLESGLTDRQREVLLTAFESGYFESPRATSGVELAELLDISQPTMTHHLREAQRRLFKSLFDSV